MSRFFALLLAVSCLTAVGQVTYPYNPDGNADGDIAVGDLQDFLVTYGNPFSPTEIMVGDSSLTYWLEHLWETVQEQQEMIESSEGMGAKSLRFPCGLNGALPHHQSLNSSALIVPPDSLFFLTNVTSNCNVPIGFEDEQIRILNFTTSNGYRSSFLTGSSPMILGEGMFLGQENCNVSGFWMKSGSVQGFSRVMTDSFVVPAQKWLVLTHYQGATGNSVLEADGVPLVEGNFYSQIQQFPTPIILGSATELKSYLTCLNDCQDQLYYVHGYIISENHFSATEEVSGSASNPEEWSCGESISYAGDEYETVQIGNRCWFAENVKFLPEVSPPSVGSESDGLPHAYVYGYKGSNKLVAKEEEAYEKFGALYNYKAVQDWELCPSGWSIADDVDWLEIELMLGLPDSSAEALETDLDFSWKQMIDEYDWVGNNKLGLSIKPAGIRHSVTNNEDQPAGTFTGGNNRFGLTYFWTPDDSAPEEQALRRLLSLFDRQKAYRSIHQGYSVRCIQDAE